MDKRQVAWASKHDWFRGFSTRDNETYIVLATVECVGLDGQVWEEHAQFTDFQALRAWAGH